MSREPGLPPGPSADRGTQGVLFHRHPLAFLRRQRDEHGALFTLRLPLAGTAVVAADPALLPRVVEADPSAGHAGEARQGLLGMVSERSVLGADGDAHDLARGRVARCFTRDALDPQRPAMRVIAEAHARNWPRERPFLLVPRVRALCDEIFVRIVLGVHDAGRAQALASAIQRMLRTPGNPPTPPPGRQAGVLGALGGRLFDRRKAPAARILAEEIDARRAAGHAGDDVIGALLAAEPPLSTG